MQEKFYIIRPDGSSIFCLPYPKDFCIHCLCLLIEDGIKYKLLSSSISVPFPCQRVTERHYTTQKYLGGLGGPQKALLLVCSVTFNRRFIRFKNSYRLTEGKKSNPVRYYGVDKSVFICYTLIRS